MADAELMYNLLSRPVETPAPGHYAAKGVTETRIIREIDQAMVFRMNRSQNMTLEFPQIIQDERDRLLEAYRADAIDVQELEGATNFLNMREEALKNEVAKIGQLWTYRTAQTDDGLGYTAPDDNWWNSHRGDYPYLDLDPESQDDGLRQ